MNHASGHNSVLDFLIIEFLNGLEFRTKEMVEM